MVNVITFYPLPFSCPRDPHCPHSGSMRLSGQVEVNGGDWLSKRPVAYAAR